MGIKKDACVGRKYMQRTRSHSDESVMSGSLLDGAAVCTVSGLTKVTSDGRQPLQRSHGLQ